jgi:hypothetical protein
VTDPLILRVAARYRCARGSLWDKVVKEISTFNKKYVDLKKVKFPLDKKSSQTLSYFCINTGNMPGAIETSFSGWVEECAPEFKALVLDKTRALNFTLLDKVLEELVPLDTFIDLVTDYRSVLQQIMNGVAPESFTYQGFKIVNTYRMSENLSRRVLEGVDYLVALFKKRGLDHLLDKGLSEIHLVPDNYYLSNPKGSGEYFESDKVIILSGRIALEGVGRFIEWVNEVFLHEFGHYIHLDYLAKEAKEAWDAGWDFQNADKPLSKKKIQEHILNLETVSDYGKTNEKEDFAETFVAFVAAPEKLTPTAKFRMQRALSLSGLYGKPVMRLALEDPIVQAVVTRSRAQRSY